MNNNHISILVCCSFNCELPIQKIKWQVSFSLFWLFLKILKPFNFLFIVLIFIYFFYWSIFYSLSSEYIWFIGSEPYSYFLFIVLIFICYFFFYWSIFYSLSSEYVWFIGSEPYSYFLFIVLIFICYFFFIGLFSILCLVNMFDSLVQSPILIFYLLFSYCYFFYWSIFYSLSCEYVWFIGSEPYSYSFYNLVCGLLLSSSSSCRAASTDLPDPFCYPSLSSIAPERSSKLHPVLAQSCCI